MPNTFTATRIALIALEAQAAVTERNIIEARAKRFAEQPALLDNIERGLSKLKPRKLRNRLLILIKEEISTPRQIGGEIPILNLKAAGIYAETLVEMESGAAPVANQ